MNPQDEIALLEEIIDEILRGLQDTLMSGEILSDEFQQQIADELNITADRIAVLSQAGAPPITPPELPKAPYDSAQIHSFKYDPKDQRLFIKYHGKYPQENGPVYSYDKVPPFIFDVFKRGAVGPKTTGRNAWHAWKQGVTPSLGAAANALIKAGGYQYQRLS